MTSPDPLGDPASALLEAAHAFQRWYRLAADAGLSTSRGDLSREQEVRLVGGLHDVAAAFARCARACREGGSAVSPVIARRRSSGSAVVEPGMGVGASASTADAKALQ
jgi:hypothetical protein